MGSKTTDKRQEVINEFLREFIRDIPALDEIIIESMNKTGETTITEALKKHREIISDEWHKTKDVHLLLKIKIQSELIYLIQKQQDHFSKNLLCNN
jgi:hypothetical protein